MAVAVAAAMAAVMERMRELSRERQPSHDLKARSKRDGVRRESLPGVVCKASIMDDNEPPSFHGFPPPSTPQAAKTPRETLRNVPKWVWVVTVIGLASFVTKAITPHTTATTLRTVPKSSVYSVTYRTEGTALYGDITYATPTGTGQQSDTDIPMKTKSGNVGLSYKMSAGDYVYLSVQNGTEQGTVVCIIEVNGVVIARNESSGAFSIASCSGNV